MTPTEQDKELRRAIVGYRIKCDYYLSDRDAGVISQEEYETAISGALDSVMQLITADRKRVALEARIDELEHTFVSYDNALASELVENPEWEYGQVSERIAELKAQKEEV